MEILIAVILLTVLTLMIAWIATEYQMIWSWIKTQVKSLVHRCVVLLQTVVKKIFSWIIRL